MYYAFEKKMHSLHEIGHSNILNGKLFDQSHSKRTIWGKEVVK